jgi:hypothetical protein
MSSICPCQLVIILWATQESIPFLQEACREENSMEEVGIMRTNGISLKKTLILWIKCLIALWIMGQDWRENEKRIEFLFSRAKRGKPFNKNLALGMIPLVNFQMDLHGET